MKSTIQIYDEVLLQYQNTRNAKIFSSIIHPSKVKSSFLCLYNKQSDLKINRINKEDFINILTAYRNDLALPSSAIEIFCNSSHQKLYEHSLNELSNSKFHQLSFLLLKRFKKKYCNLDVSNENTSSQTYSVLLNMIEHESCRLQLMNDDRQLIDMIEILLANPYVKKLNNSKRLLFFSKLYACYLHFNKGYTNSEIIKKLGISANQLKDAYFKYRNDYFNGDIQENRGIKSKFYSVINEESINFFANYAVIKEGNFTLQEAKIAYQKANPKQFISKASIRRILKNHLSLSYKLPKITHQYKNSVANKTYRFWFANHLLRFFMQDRLVISIDESSFAKQNIYNKRWLPTNTSNTILTTPNVDARCVSLLMASNQGKILLYYIIDKPVNTYIYYTFMIDLYNIIDKDFSEDRKKNNIVIIMDNAHIHNSETMNALYHYNKIPVYFTPTYTPELNFIEFIFQRIKQKYRKGIVPQKK